MYFIVAGLRIGGEKKTFADHLLVIGDAAGMLIIFILSKLRVEII